MEASSEIYGNAPKVEQPKIQHNTATEQSVPKDSRITRLISRFKSTKNPDQALQEIAQFDLKQQTDAGPKEQSLGVKDRILGILKLNKNANPDEVLTQIAESAEIVEGDNTAAKEMVENAKIVSWCIDRMRSVKDNPLGTAAFLVPVAIAAIDKMVGIPLPHDVVSVMPGALGGAISGVSMAPERYGTKGKIVGAVAGAGAGVGISKGIGHVVGGPLEVAAGYVDDGATAVAKPVVRAVRKVKGSP